MKVGFLFLAALSLAISGCSRGDGETWARLFARPGMHQQDSPEGLTVELVGEALLPGEASGPDDRCRVTALMDALRRLAAEERFGSDSSSDPPDTLICEREWEGLRLRSMTIRKNGMVLSDTVELTLDTKKPAPETLRWRAVNFRLIEPVEMDDPCLQRLTDALVRRGFIPQHGQRLGRSIWREALSVRRWGVD